MNLAQFAARVGLNEDDVYALSYSDCCALLAKYGYEITGAGVVPIPPGRSARRLTFTH